MWNFWKQFKWINNRGKITLTNTKTLCPEYGGKLHFRHTNVATQSKTLLETWPKWVWYLRSRRCRKREKPEGEKRKRRFVLKSCRPWFEKASETTISQCTGLYFLEVPDDDRVRSARRRLLLYWLNWIPNLLFKRRCLGILRAALEGIKSKGFFVQAWSDVTFFFRSYECMHWKLLFTCSVNIVASWYTRHSICYFFSDDGLLRNRIKK